MGQEVKVGRREATLVLSKRLTVRLSGIGRAIGPTFGEAYGHIGRRRGTPVGPPFVIYHGLEYGRPEGDEPFEVEICAPIAVTMDAPGGWQVQELPAGLFATLVHVGPYDTLGSAYDVMKEWIGGHDLAVAGPPREVYLSPPATPPDRLKTIVEFPVTEVGALVTTAG